MARYLVESRQQRLERTARERRQQEESGQRRLLLRVRRDFLRQTYGSSSEDERQDPPEPIATETVIDTAAATATTTMTTNQAETTPVARQGQPEPRRSGSRRSERRRDRGRQEELIKKHRQSLVDEDEDDRFFVIEKLLDRRFRANGVEEYKVRWQNYSSAWDSWEPREELERNALDMINAFNNIPQPEESAIQRHCICRTPYIPGEGAMIQCSSCNIWYHFKCLNLNMYEANSLAEYHCDVCREKNPRLKTRVKRQKIKHLTFLSHMKVDKASGVVIESPRSNSAMQ